MRWDDRFDLLGEGRPRYRNGDRPLVSIELPMAVVWRRKPDGSVVACPSFGSMNDTVASTEAISRMDRPTCRSHPRADDCHRGHPRSLWDSASDHVVGLTEVAEEQGYRRRSDWDQPLTDTHMLGGMTLQAGVDYVGGLTELFGSAHPPVYAHLALARGALEASVVSAWLSEPGITTVETKRGLCEFLYSAREVKELDLGPDGTAKVAWSNGVAQSFGWEVAGRRGRPTIDGTRRPRVGEGVTRLVGGDGDARIGDLLYSRLSAIDHMTWFGLMSALDIGAAERDERTGTATVPVTVDGGRVAAYVY